MMRFLAVFAAIVITGCATTSEQEWHWFKAGATQQDFAMDDGQCKAQAFGVPGANLFQVVMVQQNCMQGKGWIKRANKS